MMRKSYLRRKPPSSEMSLQITSMADVFMILLVFLLKGYGSGVLDVTPVSGDIKMPASKVVDGGKDALRVELSSSKVLVDGKPVAAIQDFKFEEDDLLRSGGSLKVSAALKEKWERSGQRTDLIVIADQGAPYSSIKTVLASAAISGFTDFKLAVVNGGE